MTKRRWVEACPSPGIRRLARLAVGELPVGWTLQRVGKGTEDRQRAEPVESGESEFFLPDPEPRMARQGLRVSKCHRHPCRPVLDADAGTRVNQLVSQPPRWQGDFEVCVRFWTALGHEQSIMR